MPGEQSGERHIAAPRSLSKDFFDKLRAPILKDRRSKFCACIT